MKYFINIICLMVLLPTILLANTTYIGNPISTESNNLTPFAYGFESSVSQSIYYEAEIGRTGIIRAVTYRFNGVGNAPANVNVRLYMTTSDITSFNMGGWLPYSEFTLVFEGALPVNVSGQHDITIELDTSFAYNGGNLVIMGHRPFFDNWSMSNTWQATASPGFQRIINAWDFYNIDPSIGYPNGTIEPRFPNITIEFDGGSTGTLTGLVSSQGYAIDDVDIAIEGTSLSAVTDNYGEFYISGIPTGVITVIASKYMYHDFTIETEIIANENTHIEFEIFPLEPDLKIISFAGSRWPVAYYANPYRFQVRNESLYSITNEEYSVKLMKVQEGAELDLELVELNGVDIESNELYEFVFHWEPNVIGEMLDIYAMIAFEKDLNNRNITEHQSQIISVKVQPPGEGYTYIGNPETSSFTNTAPVGYHFTNSISQSIYLAEEIEAVGLITHLIYELEAAGNIPEGKIVRFYIAPTELNTFNDYTSWQQYDTFVRVFEGELSVNEQGKYDVIVELDTPYYYNGGNIIIMAHSPEQPGFFDYNYWTNTVYYAQNRTLDVGSNNWVYDPEDIIGGYARTSVPNLAINLLVGSFGALEGIVTNNGNPLEGVLVQVDNSTRQAYTNVNGEYFIPSVSPGIISITASRHGYDYYHQDNILIIENQTIDVSFSMNKMHSVTVTGTVISSDTNSGLSDAYITLEGYENYSATTIDDGTFVIPDVYSGFHYEINIIRDNYESYLGQFIFVGNNDLVLDNIILMERTNRPRNVTVNIVEENQNYAAITWEAPLSGVDKWFAHAQSDIWMDAMGNYGGAPVEFTTQIRFTQEQLQNLGIAGTTLTRIAFHAFMDTADFTIQVYTGGTVDPTDPGTLVHEQPVTIIPNQWNDFELTSQIEIPTSGELWFGYHVNIHSGYIASVTDVGAGYWGFGDIVRWEGNWISLANMGFDANWMIRGMAEGASTRTYFGQSNEDYIVPIDKISQNMQSFLSAHPQFSSSDFNNNVKSSRTLDAYNIYLTKIEDLYNENAWTEIATNINENYYNDNNWNNLPYGVYRYVVKAVYSNDNLSLPAFSNVLEKDMYSKVEIQIYAENNAPVEGAVVKLSNNTGLTEYVSTATDKIVVFPSVRVGDYTINVIKEGFMTYVDSELSIYSDSFEYNVFLGFPHIILEEGFEGFDFPPQGWTIIDADGDEHNWMIATIPLHIVNSGFNAVMSESMLGGIGAINPDNYLITSQITFKENIQANLQWHVATHDQYFPIETYSVMVSTTTPSIENFYTIFTETLTSQNAIYQERNISLNNLAGNNVYIAFRHHNSTNNFKILIDDIVITEAAKTVSENDIAKLPKTTDLIGNYPNPFNPSTNIRFNTAKPGVVNINIYNIRGQKIITILDSFIEAGEHTIIWNGIDEIGRNVSSGVYFYQMKFEDKSHIKRMVLMK